MGFKFLFIIYICIWSNHIMNDCFSFQDLPDMLEPLNQSNDSDVLEGNNSDSSDSPSTSTDNGATSLHSMNDMSNGTTRIVTLGDGSQPQLVTMQSLEGISAGTLQVMSLLYCRLFGGDLPNLSFIATCMICVQVFRAIFNKSLHYF